MNKMKKLLSIVLAIVMALSCMSVTASAATTAYKSVDELKALDAYSDYGQVTRLTTEERASIVQDFLDSVLPGLGINMGEVFNVLGLSITLDLSNVDRLCYSLDTVKSTLSNGLAGIAMAIVNLGVLEQLSMDTWASGYTRAGSAQLTLFAELLELLSNNTTLVNSVLTNGLDLGLVGGLIGGGLDLSSINEIVKDLPSLVKGLVFPMLERWDDTLEEVKWLDTNGKGDGKVEETVNTFVQKLFNNNMSITTVKYDANGTMTSEHTAMPFVTAAPGTPSNTSPRCVYVMSAAVPVPGTTLTVYHIVDEKEAKDLAKTPDEVNGSPAAYTYFKEAQTYVMAEEVEGNGVYVWKATDELGNVTTLKWYNDDSQFLKGFNGESIDLTTMSAGDLLYTFIPTVFDKLATVVLNGSVKKILAEFFGAKFEMIGKAGSDEITALGSDPIFAEEQGEYVFEWSDYAIVDGVHYYRYLDDVYKADLSATNNYFDVIKWDFEITGDFMNQFIPSNDDSATNRLLLNLNNFLVKVANTVLVDSVMTEDSISGDTAQWTKPAFVSGGNDNLIPNIKALAQTFIKLAPQHIFGSDFATNPRCYYNLLISEDNDTVLTGIAAQLVDALMPSMTLPAANDIIGSGAKVGAILAAAIREFVAYLIPEYNFDALIYTSFENGTKTFVTGVDSEYWFDVILTMGINVGFEYIRAFADMGEGTDEWNAFVSNVGYDVDGKTYAAGTTQAALNAEWEGMLDYVVDWALSTEKEWTWKMANLVEVDGLTIDLSTAQDPFVKLDKILFGIIPFDEILNITTTEAYPTRIEKFLRYDLILGLVDLRWDALINTVAFNGPNNYFRTGNVLDQLASILKRIVNGLLDKIGGGDYKLIPDSVTDFDSLAKQASIRELAVGLVGKLYTAYQSGLLDTALPLLNMFIGWKTADPQAIADPVVWTTFRDGNDYAFQYNVAVGGAIDAETKIHFQNNSSGMLEIHRNSSVEDHAYEINIKSVTADATTNKLSFTYDNVVSPWETIDIQVNGTYNGEEATTVTIAYDYVGKDGKPVGGTQYTSVTFLVSNQYEDANVEGRFDGDDDEGRSGIPAYKKFQFTEDIYGTVTGYRQEVFYVSPTIDLSNETLEFAYVHAPDWTGSDCDGNATGYIDMTGNGATYFDYNDTQAKAGWPATMPKDTNVFGYLYSAAAGVTAETEFPYGTYDMGQYCIKYGSGEKKINIDFIYYNSYGIYDIYTENKDNGYNANQGVDAAIYNEYNDAWKMIVYGATYPMMTEANGHAETDYVTAIQPYIPAAIERFEAAKEAYEKALADAQASGAADAALPSHIVALQEEIDNDFINDKEINFQDYEYYEYFNYNDIKVAAENLYRSYLVPEIMDTYYILGSGIREAELNNVIAAEDNEFIAAGITASREKNDQEAIDASIAARDEWKMPVTTKLVADDFTARLAYYKQFLNNNKEDADHRYFLNKEIAFIEAQGLTADYFEEVSWGRFADALDEAKAVAAGNDPEGFSDFNSRIYDVKYNLMVAYKQLLLKRDSLINAGGTADLMANADIANEIFASLAAGDGVWALAADYEGEEDAAYAALISALGYYYEGEDGITYNLYADSALEYIDNDRPNKQANQAKVDAANTALVAAIENFEKAVTDPPTLEVKPSDEFEYSDYVVLDKVNTNYDEFTGIIYGIDTLDQNDMMEQLASLADALKASTNEDTHIVIEANEQGYESTGAMIYIVDSDENVLETYVFIYFGDIDGDAMISANDALIAEWYEIAYEGIESYAAYVAADLDGDGMPSANDALMAEWYEIAYEGIDYQYNLGQNAMNNMYEWIF